MNVLITGGAGFIGTHLATRLLEFGHKITIIDNFNPQIHAGSDQLAPHLSKHVTLIRGDVRDRDELGHAIRDQEIIFHLAAETGTGQSMYEMIRYEDVNIKGTTTLFELIATQRPPNLRKVVLSSSRAVYGEGRYKCLKHGYVYPKSRLKSEMINGHFEPNCPNCGAQCISVSTIEESSCHPTSFYGLTKLVQEQIVTQQSEVLSLPAAILRYQNVYGPGQSLNNPYTGILAIFFNLAREGKGINVFEDGQETRDFVYIDDVINATIAAALLDVKDTGPVNVGKGTAISVLEIANSIVSKLRSSSDVKVTGDFRVGDIRHNFACIEKLKSVLNIEPAWDFIDGIEQFLNWASDQRKVESGFSDSINAMKRAGLFHEAGH